MALGILSFVVAVAFWPGVPTPALAPKWAMLSVGLAAVIWCYRPKLTPGHWLGAAFLAWATLSMLWTPVLYEGAFNLWQLVLVAACFLIGSAVTDLRPVYIGFALGMIPSAIAAIGQVTGVYVVDQMVSPAGLFSNKNFMGEAAGMALVPCLYLALVRKERRHWYWLAIAPTVGLVLSSSRGAILGVVLAVAAYAWPRARTASIVIQFLIVAVGLVMLSVPELSWTFGIRMQIWADTVQGLNWLGHGIGSFYVQYPVGATAIDTLWQRPEHAHNDFLEVVFELGPIGAALFCGLLAVALSAPAEVERLVLICFLVEGVFGFPVHMAATGMVAGLVAGRLCSLRPRLRDVLDGWRGFGLGRLAPPRRVSYPVSASEGGG